MRTIPLVDRRTRLVGQLIGAGAILIVVMAMGTVLMFPADPRLDWLDIVQEGVFVLGGAGAVWGAWRVNSPIITAGTLLIAMALALELADEFIQPVPIVDQWIPTALSAAGLGTFAWGLAELAARERDGRRKLQMSEREIAAYQTQLEVAAMKDEFVATMSDELRTPLTAVIGAAGTLDEGAGGPLSRDQRALVSKISTSAGDLLEIINDIVELSRLEAGRASLVRENVDIARCCDEAWAAVAGRAQSKWLDSSFGVPRASGSIFTDGRRLKQMLVNLLDNAVKFTPSGGRIGLDVSRDEHSGRVFFTVWDSGPGIDARDQDRLFQPFVQLDPGAGGEPGGTGLGLALVRRTARALGGEARVTSEVGNGSRFTISLPVNPPAA